MENQDKDTIYIRVPVTDTILAKSESEDGEGRRYVKGFASTEKIDKAKEQILQKGIDFEPLKKSGFINWDHLYEQVVPGVEVPFIIGYPTRVEMLAKGLHVEGELLQGTPEEIQASPRLRLANEAWLLQNKLQKSGQRTLGWSVEGGIRERRGNKIVRCVVKNLALTHKPEGEDTSVEAFAKSLCCGKCSPLHPEYNPAHKCGNKEVEIPGGLPQLAKAIDGAMATDTAGSLLIENLDRGMSKVLYGTSDCGCYDRETGRFAKGVKGAMDHMSGCLGYPADQVKEFLRKLLKGAGKNAELAALVKQAGLTNN